MQKLILPAIIMFIIFSGAWFLAHTPEPMTMGEGEEKEEKTGSWIDKYEWLLSRDPRTGKIPEGIRHRELTWAQTQQPRQTAMMNALASNVYQAAGPSVNGGRTRALGIDVRYNGTTNKVVIAGSVSGGIFRSEDGGFTWAYVHPSNEISSVTCVAQDPRPGFQDIWYAGTGEQNQTAEFPNAFVLGFGMLKSIDNGKTWTKLASTATGTEFTFDSFFDLNFNISVHPVTGDVYVAAQEAILRSQNGGISWNFVLRGTVATNRLQGITDVLINKAGTKIYAAFSGRNPDRAIAGVWMSSTGNAATWTRIAGGMENQPDSVPGWRAYNADLTNFPATSGWGRIVLGFTANEDLLVLTNNSLNSDNGQSEADLFRANTSGTPITWSANLGQNITAKYITSSGTDDKYFRTYVDGYNMAITGHPTQNNTIYIGGVYLYRSTDGFQTTTTNTLIGGTEFAGPSDTFSDPDGASHVDFHNLKFDPSSNNRLITASDGGIAITPDATASVTAWQLANKNYQSFQYYFVGIDQATGSGNYIGGAQDNGISVRDRTGFSSNVFGPVLPDPNDHYIFPFGDGAQSYIASINNVYYIFGSAFFNFAYRIKTTNPVAFTRITPQDLNTSDDSGPTYYQIDDDNPNIMYFPATDSLYRTTDAANVTATTGWTRMTGVDPAITGKIYALATTRGNYTPANILLIGTDAGKIYRLTDPANTDPSTAPVDITPTGMTAGSLVKDISVNPRNQDTVLAVVSNFNVSSIFWTGNATAASPTWQLIEGNLSLPSVRSCEIVAKTTGVEYYAGTTVGLFSTTTISGASTVWTRETGGPGGMMSTNIINSLAYRWKDNTLLVGTHSNGMFVANIGNAINLPTGINTPIRNDKSFIVNAYPTITNGILNYQAGNMLNIKSIQVQIVNLSGQVLYNQKAAYGSGNINTTNLPKGLYILTITSSDRKYQFIRKFNKG